MPESATVVRPAEFGLWAHLVKVGDTIAAEYPKPALPFCAQPGDYWPRVQHPAFPDSPNIQLVVPPSAIARA